jgi:Flp pilus assembly protein TadG
MWGIRKRNERGAAVVETALCLCFLVLPIVFGTIGYAYMLAFRQTVSQSAAEGARAAAVAPSSTSNADRISAAYAAVDAAMSTGVGGLKCGQNHLSCDATVVTNCDDGTSGNCIKVTVEYPYRDHALLPSLPGLGVLLPSKVTYSAMAQVS